MPNHLINCRMRSIIDHLKQSRDFPRLRIGMPAIYFIFYIQGPTLKYWFPNVLQALDGHRRQVLSVSF
jgi:hypothetical protein